VSKTEMHVLPWNQTTLAFLLAGKCYVTLEVVQTGTRYTYEIKQKVDKGKVTDPKTGQQKETVVKRYDFWFVAAQPGAIGDARPCYLGVIDPDTFRTTASTAKNKLANAENINLIGDVIRLLRAGQSDSHHVKIWHCGKCGRCNKPLKVPSSILTGLGPECASQMGIKMADASPTTIEKIAALG